MLKAKILILGYLIFNLMLAHSCANDHKSKERKQDKFHLVVLDPGHFHAALLQKSMYGNIDSTVKVFAPEGDELNSYLDFIKGYNNRAENPTHWIEKVYTGQDYLQEMLKGKQAENIIVVIAGNNKKKAGYINQAVNAGMNVLADKPMVITPEGFEQLKKAFKTAKEKNVLLYDIMTERYAMTNILQKMFLHLPGVFGSIEKGSPDAPSIVFKSAHFFYKEVSGKPLIRPAWYFDTNQQGEGIVDVTVHLVDLIQWECFPETVFDYKSDVKMLDAHRWPTKLTLAQFSKVTGVGSLPGFLQKELKNGQLSVYANGEINYLLKGIHAEVSVEWNFAAPDGSGDTYFSSIKGTKATLIIRQDSAQGYKTVLYIKPVQKDDPEWKAALDSGLAKIHQSYPGVSLTKTSMGWEVVIPEKYKTGHEQRFSKVVQKYLQYLQAGKIPEWEISCMLAKYYTTTQALKMAASQQGRHN